MWTAVSCCSCMFLCVLFEVKQLSIDVDCSCSCMVLCILLQSKEPSTDNLDVDYNFFEENIWPTLSNRVPAFEALKVGMFACPFMPFQWAQEKLCSAHSSSKSFLQGTLGAGQYPGFLSYPFNRLRKSLAAPIRSQKTSFGALLGGGRHHGQQRKCWMDNTKEWTSLSVPELFMMAFCRKEWKRISAESSCMSPPQPNGSRD